MTGLRERKKLELRERILDAATTLIAERGLQATRIDEIAERVDISQTTFFNYFRAKADLVDALLARLLDLMDAVLDDAAASGAPAPEQLRAVFHASADLKERQQRLVRDLISEAVRSPGRGSGSMERLRATVGGIVAAGQAAGEIRTDLPADVLADAVVALYSGVALRWNTDESYPVAERLRTTAALAIDLVQSRPGGRSSTTR